MTKFIGVLPVKIIAIKNMCLAALLLSSVMLPFVSAEAARRAPRQSRAISSVCTTVIRLPNAGFVYKNAAPLRAGGEGSRLIGFREEPTVIAKRSGFLAGSTRIFDSNGTVLGGCPKASATGFAGRYRCSNNTRAMRRKAVKNTRSPAVYFTLSGTKRCLMVPEPGGCYGSNKGKCNTVIK